MDKDVNLCAQEKQSDKHKCPCLQRQQKYSQLHIEVGSIQFHTFNYPFFDYVKQLI